MKKEPLLALLLLLSCNTASANYIAQPSELHISADYICRADIGFVSLIAERIYKETGEFADKETIINDIKNHNVFIDIVIREEGKTVLAKLIGFESLSHYTDDLKFGNYPNSGIMKIYHPKAGHVLSYFDELVCSRPVFCDKIPKHTPVLVNFVGV